MKKQILFLVSLLLGSMQASGEFYFPFNQEWKFQEETFCDEGTEIQLEVKTFGDSLEIAGNTYYSYLTFYLRSEGNKVLYHVSDNMPDVVLYDFDLQIGDSLIFFEDAFPSKINTENTTFSIVTNIDTITLLDQRQARRIHYNNRANDIEFVGSEHGLLAPLNLPLATCKNISLLCVSINGVPIYETSPGACSSTDLQELEHNDSFTRKVIREGQLLIFRNATHYNALGAKVQ